MSRYLIPVMILGVLAIFFARGLTLNPGYVPSPLIGKEAPSFKLPQLKDPSLTLGSEDMLGRLSLLNVWATWCVGCRQEHQYLNELAQNNTIPIYGLNWKDDRATAVNWLNTLGDPYIASAFDGDGRVAIDWGVYGAPETFLIGQDSSVIYKHIAPLTNEIWEMEFLPLIREHCQKFSCSYGDLE